MIFKVFKVILRPGITCCTGYESYIRHHAIVKCYILNGVL